MVKYTLSGDGVGSIFTIEPSTGDIHALRSLDREEKAYYTLKAQAVDVFTGRALEPESTFVIKVQDINDNEPKFLEGPYVASVPEMSPVGKSAALHQCKLQSGTVIIRNITYSDFAAFNFFNMRLNSISYPSQIRQKNKTKYCFPVIKVITRFTP